MFAKSPCRKPFPGDSYLRATAGEAAVRARPAKKSWPAQKEVGVFELPSPRNAQKR